MHATVPVVPVSSCWCRDGVCACKSKLGSWKGDLESPMASGAQLAKLTCTFPPPFGLPPLFFGAIKCSSFKQTLRGKRTFHMSAKRFLARNDNFNN